MTYQDLLSKFNKEGLTEDELKQFNKFILEENSKKLSRGSKIQELKDAIKNYQIEVVELFDIDIIKSYNSKTPAIKQVKNKVIRDSDNNEVLLKFSNGKRPAIYKKGRIYENQKGEIKQENETPWAVTPTIFEGRTTKESLLEVATEDGKAYFSSAPGIKELEEIIKIVSSKK